MANKIFLIIFIIGLTYGVIFNQAEEVVTAMLESPKRAFYIFLDLYILLIFWGGLIEICKDSGMLKKISKIISFVIHPLFKKLDKDDEALTYMSLNLVSNIFSMGSIATPFGLMAMKRLQELNDNKDVASDEMITFVLLNTAGFCIIPTSLIALRMDFKSINPTNVIPYIIFVSLMCTIFSILLDIEARRYVKL